MAELALHTLRSISPDIELAVLLDPDGAICGVSPSMDEDDELVAVAAPLLTTLTSLADRSARELGRGMLDTLVLRGPNGHVVVQELQDGRMLAAVARSGARLGLLLDDVASAASQIARSAA